MTEVKKSGGRTVVLTGGGTAGHVLPHFALLPYLRRYFDKIYYVGGKNGIEEKLVKSEGLPFYGVTCAKLHRSFTPKNLAIPFKLVKGILEAKKLLKDLRPDVIFSKGGFVSYPVVRAAAKLGIPLVAHESDMTLGLANRMSVRYCTKICTTFKQAAGAGGKFIWTGSPIRAKIFEGSAEAVRKRHDFVNGKRNLLVMGGSLGAARINEVLRESLPDLDFNTVHICGKGKGALIQRAGYVQIEYAGDIENYFAWADIVVSRAGSNALCELTVLGKAVLFIPLSTGRGDQIDNAKEVLQNGTGAVLYEENLNKKTFLEGIEDVWRNRSEYQALSRRMPYNGTGKIYDTICSVVCQT